MATAEKIEAALYDRLAANRGVSSDDIRVELGAGGGIDSLEGVELLIAAEELFGVHVPDDELTSSLCRSMGRMARRIASKMH